MQRKQQFGQLKMTEEAMKCLLTLMHYKIFLSNRSGEDKDATKHG